MRLSIGFHFELFFYDGLDYKVVKRQGSRLIFKQFHLSPFRNKKNSLSWKILVCPDICSKIDKINFMLTSLLQVMFHEKKCFICVLKDRHPSQLAEESVAKDENNMR
jgi:hypothetical protein